MKRISKIFMTVLLIGLMVVSCKKGDTGPAGATGATGPAGPTGPTGSANVIYSAWSNVTFTGSGTSYSAQINAPGVTQDILDKGVVKTYFKFGTSVYEGNYSNIPTGASIYQFLTLGVIHLQATFDASYPWRYVIIPGGIASPSSMLQTDSNKVMLQGVSSINQSVNSLNKTELENMSYEDICKRFDIPQ